MVEEVAAAAVIMEVVTVGPVVYSAIRSGKRFDCRALYALSRTPLRNKSSRQRRRGCYRPSERAAGLLDGQSRVTQLIEVSRAVASTSLLFRSP
jgi:hypothetical protein